MQALVGSRLARNLMRLPSWDSISSLVVMRYDLSSANRFISAPPFLALYEEISCAAMLFSFSTSGSSISSAGTGALTASMRRSALSRLPASFCCSFSSSALLTAAGFRCFLAAPADDSAVASPSPPLCSGLVRFAAAFFFFAPSAFAPASPDAAAAAVAEAVLGATFLGAAFFALGAGLGALGEKGSYR